MQSQLLRIICNADDRIFTEKDSDVPEELMKIIEDNHGIPCGGEQGVGLGCLGCPFIDYEYEED